MKKLTILFSIFFLLFSIKLSADNISNVQIFPLSPASLLNNEQVAIGFDYFTTEAGGVRIFVRPFSGGSLSPDYAASGSILYPAGAGFGNGDFTITLGTVIVDQLRFQMYNADQSVLILEFYVDVFFIFGEHSIRNIAFTPGTPNSLQNNEDVNITFDYGTSEAGGVRIWARPFTNGSLSPSYAASGSILYPVGLGSGTGSFTISGGDVTVDAVRFQMWDNGQANLLFEFFVPVEFVFGNNSISGVVLTPPDPALMLFGEDIIVDFIYSTNEAGGVRIFARPFTGGALTPGYGASGSPLYPVGSGFGTGTFHITGGETNIDAIRFQIWDAGQTTLLYEYFYPVNYFYSDHKVFNITYLPNSPAHLVTNQYVGIAFDYATNWPGDVRIFFRPFSGGGLALGYAASGSPAYSTGLGSGTAEFTIQGGSVVVDEMRVRMYNSDQSQMLLEYFFPVLFTFDTFTDIGAEDGNIPTAYALSQNYPNPFNPATTINYQLPEPGFVSLKIYDLLGNEVATVVDRFQNSGSYSVEYNAGRLSSGVYFYTLRSNSYTKTLKMILMK